MMVYGNTPGYLRFAGLSNVVNGKGLSLAALLEVFSVVRPFFVSCLSRLVAWGSRVRFLTISFADLLWPFKGSSGRSSFSSCLVLHHPLSVERPEPLNMVVDSWVSGPGEGIPLNVGAIPRLNKDG